MGAGAKIERVGGAGGGGSKRENRPFQTLHKEDDVWCVCVYVCAVCVACVSVCSVCVSVE